MKRTERRSGCPVSFALETFGDRWSLLVLRDLMFMGKTTYTDFLRSEERIATNVLASRLRQLESAGVLSKHGAGRATSYALTEKGLALLPVILDIVDWSVKYDRNTAADPAFVRRLRKNRKSLIAEIEGRLRRTYGIVSGPRRR